MEDGSDGGRLMMIGGTVEGGCGLALEEARSVRLMDNDVNSF